MDIRTNSNESLQNITSTVLSFSVVSFTSNNSSNDNARENIRIIQGVTASLGIVANLTVIVVFLNHKKLRRKIPNIFIINQSSADLFCSLLLLLISLTINNTYDIRADGILGYLECSIWNDEMFLWGGLLTSTWNLVCLTVERYLELVYPLWHKTHFKMRYIYMAIVFVWVFGIGLTASYMMPTSTVIDGVCRVETLWPSDEVRTAFGIFLMSIQFIIPCMVLIICYGKITWVLTKRINTDLMKNKSQLDNSDSTSDAKGNAITIRKGANPGKDKFQLARRNTIKTLLIVGLCFIVCWSQNEILYFLYNCGYDIDFNTVYYEFTILMVFLNCTINPFIYLIKYRDYQEALKLFFHCNKQQEDDISFNSSVISSSNSTNKINY